MATVLVEAKTSYPIELTAPLGKDKKPLAKDVVLKPARRNGAFLEPQPTEVDAGLWAEIKKTNRTVRSFLDMGTLREVAGFNPAPASNVETSGLEAA